MPADHKKIPDDELLNYSDAHTGTMDRYRRIMQHRGNEAMLQLSNRLQGVTETIDRAAQLVQTKADEAIASANATARDQRRQQQSMTWLTVALAISTALYTILSAISSYQAYRGNRIQAQIASTAREQLVAAREANELQRKSLQSAAVTAVVPTAPSEHQSAVPKK